MKSVRDAVFVFFLMLYFFISASGTCSIVPVRIGSPFTVLMNTALAPFLGFCRCGTASRYNTDVADPAAVCVVYARSLDSESDILAWIAFM